MPKIICVVGARPNYMKIAPLVAAMRKYRGIKQVLVHTGQHYDENMSQIFFKDLDMPRPDLFLNVGSGSHAEQTARVLVRFEKVILDEKPDAVVVAGDVNSTLACALAAGKAHVRVVHIEAGLRSFDRSMPEEINRMLTDQMSDFLFTSCEDANLNLKREGISESKIYFVGNLMIDTLAKNIAKARLRPALAAHKKYAVLTIHRPSNVDNKTNFTNIAKALQTISDKLPVYFPVHPRTLKKISAFGLNKYFAVNFVMLEPLGYLDFLNLYMNSDVVLTDSGGIQEETSYLNIPCITLRDNTERPITITNGTNVLAGNDTSRITGEFRKIVAGRQKRKKCLRLWDGKSAGRVANILVRTLKGA